MKKELRSDNEWNFILFVRLLNPDLRVDQEIEKEDYVKAHMNVLKSKRDNDTLHYTRTHVCYSYLLVTHNVISFSL